MERRLYRSRKERIIGGVAGGIGEYVGLDPVIVRLAFVVLSLFAGLGVLPYIILWIVIPEEPQEVAALRVARNYTPLDLRQRNLLIGGALVVAGVLLLAREFRVFWWWASLGRLWPVLLVAAGAALLIDRARSK
jgi:phage shock protein C